MTQRAPIALPAPAAAPGPTHCRVAWATGTQFQSELALLLHRRLRVVALITALPLFAFLIHHFLDPDHPSHRDLVGRCLHALATAIAAALAAVLWSRPTLPYCLLRKLELVLFGTLAVFFSWLQWGIFRNELLAWAAEVVSDLEVVRLSINMTAVRWFFLIVIYGVFVPNTWRRCAAATGLTALMPLLLTPASAWWHDHLSHELLDALFDLGILMGTAVAVAVFGAYRFEVLQKQAFEARQLGQYRLGRKLGAGGMGEVYEAEHVLLCRRCAIKLIRPEQTRDPAVFQRFEREVRAMATLTHPNTAEVYDYGRSDDGTFYYVMEYLPGLNLEALVQRYGPVPPARAIHFLRQVCGALREAHGVGLLHRDIKPSNIIACRRGGIDDVVKLLDFGLVQTPGVAAEAVRLTIQGMVLGSPPFMSPEQAMGRNNLDARTDIYSLGGVGIFLLTGRPPFVRETPMEMMLAHAFEPVDLPAEHKGSVPEDLREVLLRCLSKAPESRYASVREVEEALAGCAAAGAWTEEKAAAWWREAEAPTQTIATEMPTVVTAEGT